MIFASEAKISKLRSLSSDPRMNPKGYILITRWSFFCINVYPLTDPDKCLVDSLTYQLVLVYRTKPFSVVVAQARQHLSTEGDIDGMIAFCAQTLAQMKPGTTIIPDHGPITDLKALEDYI